MPKRTGKKILSIILCVVLMVSCVCAAFAEDVPSEPAVQQTQTTEQPVAETSAPSPTATAEVILIGEPTAEPTKEAAPTQETASETTPGAEASVTPEEPAQTETTAEPEASAAPEASATAEASASPEASEAPEATAEPEVKELTASVAADTGAKLSAFAGDALTFTAHYEGGKEPVVAQLTLSQDGTLLSSEYKETTTVTATVGTYVMTLTVTDADGVSVTASRTVTVSSYTRDAESIEQINSTVKQVKLTGDYAADIIAIAESQLGYEASRANFIIDLDGKQRGYTRYGAWYDWKHNGDKNAEYLLYGDWCASFISFCGTQAGIPTSVLPHDTGAQQLLKKLGSRFVKAKDHTPKPGELVFFELEGKDSLADHVGIVSAVSESGITTIEGNKGSAVAKGSYALDDKRILGYATITATPWEDMIPSGEDIEVTDVADVLPEDTAPEAEGEQSAEDPNAPITGKTNINAVNLRSQASTDSIVVAHVTQGTEVTLLSAQTVGDKTWYRIEYEGKSAYVLASLIDVNGGRTVPVEGEEAPVEEPVETPVEEPVTEEPIATEEPVAEEPAVETTDAPVAEEPVETPAADTTPAVIDPVTDIISGAVETPVVAEPAIETPTVEETEAPADEEPQTSAAEESTEPAVAPEGEEPVSESEEVPTEEPVPDLTEEEQAKVLEENMHYLLTLSADTTLYGEFGDEETVLAVLPAGETVSANAFETLTGSFETETAVVSYAYVSVYSTVTDEGATAYFANPDLAIIDETTANATDAAALLDALNGYVTDAKLEEKAAVEPEQPAEPEDTVWSGKYSVTLAEETALYAALSPIEDAQADPYGTGFAGENQTGALAAGETLTADAAQTRSATFLNADGSGVVCEYATWFSRQNEAGATEYFISGDLAAISAILSSDADSAAKIEALRPYCINVTETAQTEAAQPEEAGTAIGALVTKDEGVNLKDISVTVAISPAKAKLGDTVTLSANITSPDGLDGVKLQWQHCILQIVDGKATANWQDAEGGVEASYSFTLTEETQRYTWRLHLSAEEAAEAPAE